MSDENLIYEKAQCYYRTGELLVSLQWAESVLADLLVLKAYPADVEILNREARFSETAGVMRIELWEMSFGPVVNKIKADFREDLSDGDAQLLEDLVILRNALAHSRISTGKAYLLYAPANARQKQRLRRFLSNPDEVGETEIFKFGLGDDAVYNWMRKIIHTDTQNLLEKLAYTLHVDFAKLC